MTVDLDAIRTVRKVVVLAAAGPPRHGDKMKEKDGLWFMSRALKTRIAALQRRITLVGWHAGCGLNRWSEVAEQLGVDLTQCTVY